MPVYRLDNYHVAFPHPSEAEPDGLLAVGGALREDWLLAAYAQGIFPWFNEGEPILWWSPDPRMVLFPERVKVSKSLAQVLRKGVLRCTVDRDFANVITACARTPRRGQNGTWITNAMRQAYTALHRLGVAHSVEVWQGEALVGGLYGVSLGGAFYGESMYSHVPNASKVALVHLCEMLARRGFKLIDCQVHTPHLERMGATLLSRDEFLSLLDEALGMDTWKGNWSGG
jgi:leucyl/phenylalanyl-tRNA--protein transferase